LVEGYRAEFRPSQAGDRATVCVALAFCCARSDAAAKKLAGEVGNDFVAPSVVGEPKRCWDTMLEIAARYDVGELVLLDIGRRYPDRARCYELIAESAPAG